VIHLPYNKKNKQKGEKNMVKPDEIINVTKIKNMLNDSNVSGYSIAQITGVSQATISKIRTGVRKFDDLSAKTLLKLQKAVDNKNLTRKNGDAHDSKR
jgi:hypothetical protein